MINKDKNVIIEYYINTYKKQLYAFEDCYGNEIMACPQLQDFTKIIDEMSK